MRVLLFLAILGELTCWGLPLHYPLQDADLQRWSVAHGFPEETVTALAQSSDGYLWVGTNNGLLRFDGARPVATLDKILLGSDRQIAWVVAVGSNQLWALTTSGSIAVLKRDRYGTFLGTNFTVERPTVNLPATARTIKMEVDPSGRVLVVRSDTLLVYDTRFSPASGLPPPEVLRPPTPEPISYACLGTDGEIFALQGNKLHRIYRGLWKQLPAQGIPPDASFEKILHDGKGGLWIASSSGLLLWANNRVLPADAGAPTLRTHVTALLRDKQGALWAGNSAGICRVASSRGDCRSISAPGDSDEVSALLEDGRGNIWAGKRWGGVLRVSERLFDSYTEEMGMKDSPFLCVEEDHAGQIWVGSSGGVYRIGKNGKIQQFHHGQKLAVRTILNLPDGDLLLATNQGILRQPAGSPDKLRFVNKRLRDVGLMYRGTSGHYYLATGEQLLLAEYDARAGLRVLAAYNAPKVRAVVEDAQGTVWAVSLPRGIMRLRDGRMEVIEIEKPMPGLTWMDLTVDSSGLFLLGSSRGLWGFDPREGKFRTALPYSEADWVFRSLDDGRGQYWLATRNGILRAERDSLLRYLRGNPVEPREQRYTFAEGLPSLNFGIAGDRKGLLSTNGNIYFLSLGGVVYFEPAKLAREPGLSGKLAIRSVEVNGNPMKPAAVMELPAGAERLDLHYEAVNMALNRAFKYSYKLEGYDQKWFEAGTGTSATYTNLHAGPYTFHVRVTNSSSIKEIALPIEVQAFYWETLPFRIAVGIGIFLLMGGVFLWRHAALVRRNAELERGVRERTIDLEAATQMAREATTAKAEFLATMSHEIRTPMNGVIGMLSLLEATGLDADQRAMVRTVHSSGESLMAIVNDILDFSKLEVGKVVLESIAFDLRQLVEETAALFRPAMEAKSLTLWVKIGGDVPLALSGDPVRVRQVISNLISNAIKFTSAGGVRLELEWEDGAVKLAVQDTGPGIAREHLPRLFEMFSQADASTNRHFGGTGLGLSICRRLVEAMSGRIEVESATGHGTTFIVTIPLPPAKPASLPATADSAARSSIAGLRVLVAEDNATNALITRRMLERAGCLVTHVMDGEQAVRDAISGDADIILMDCQMPVMDGYEATRRLRSLQVSTPIIACTANALSEERDRCVAAGMNDYLAKPFRREDLEEVLLRWMPAPVDSRSKVS
ncbi:MAG: ATP-binding protein [Bryobacteraceae bacterium]